MIEPLKSADSFGGEGCVDNVAIDESIGIEHLEGEDDHDDPVLLAWKEKRQEYNQTWQQSYQLQQA